MKKIVSLCVCVVLIFGACFLSGISERSLGGKANGENAKIKTSDEFTELLQSASLAISQIGSESTDSSRALKTKNKAGILLSENTDTETPVSLPYSGMTVYQTTSASFDYIMDRRDEFSYNGSLSQTSGMQYVDIKEDKTVDGVYYLTDDAMLLIASGTINYDVNTEEVTFKYLPNEDGWGGTYVRDEIIKVSYELSADVAFKLYMDADDSYMMIDKFYMYREDHTLTGEEAEEAKEALKESQEQINLLLGKWFDMKDLGSTAALMELCMSLIRDNLKYQSDYFASNSEKAFTEVYNTYTLKTKYFEEYVKGNDLTNGDEISGWILIDAADLEDISGYLTIDLSAAQAPKMSSKISGSYSNEEQDLTAQYGCYTKLSFANIDNTEISKPQDVLTAEEMEELYN